MRELEELAEEIRELDGSGASDDIIVSPIDLQCWSATIEYHVNKVRSLLELLLDDFADEDPEGGIRFTNEFRLARIRQIKEVLEDKED